MLLFGLGAFPAKTCRSQGWDPEADYEGNSQGCSTISLSLSRLAVRLRSLSRTWQGSSLPTVDETSKSLFQRWPNSGMAWGGECSTAGISESPSHAKESTLLPAIETQNVPQRYFLSPNAAAGILRRTDRMGRTLFPPLRKSLEILSKVQSSKDLPIASTPVLHAIPEPTGVERTSVTRTVGSAGSRRSNANASKASRTDGRSRK